MTSSLPVHAKRSLAFLAHLVVCAWLVAALAGTAFAQGTIRSIEVEGTQRIDPDTVRSYMMIRPGDAADAERLDRALKALFATGLFADVTLRREGDVIMVRVVENPIINRIAFEGNRRINDESLQNEVQLRPRVVYTRTKVQSDVTRILNLYRRGGRFAATVEPKVIQLPQNRVDLVFEIEEGPVTAVRRISFVGNKRYGDSTLREAIQTKESRWYRFLTSDDTYDPDRLAFDRELLRRYYLARGYADFRVVSAVAELTPDREGFYITFTIEEGERYSFGELDVISRLRDVDVSTLKEKLTITSGEWYNADAVEASINALTDEIGSRGYAFVDVRPRINRDREKKTIDVTFEIQEGPRVYVDRINISGNVRTLDKVIRREIRLAEGDAFNTAKLRLSRQRIRNLGFFEKVDVTNVPGDAPDRTNVNVEVQERATGELSFGVGYSTSDGPLTDVVIRERNFLGRGQDLRLAFTLSTRRQEIDLSFTEPYLFDTNVAGGIDIFHRTRDYQRESSYDYKTTGFTLRTGFNYTENLRQTVRHTIRQDDISDVSDDASRYIKDQEGKTTSSITGHDIIYDRRDDRFDPTEGYYLGFGNDIAPGGIGDVAFFRTRVRAGVFYSLADEYVVSLTGEAGYIVGLGQDVRIQHRFFLGGENLRGFETAGVGPRDTSTDDALGGNQYFAGSVEMRFPTGLPKELGIRGSIFTDFGALTKVDDKGPDIADSGLVRVTVGVGMLWRSPFGPIRVSLAKPVVKEDYDKDELFRFTFGTRF